MVTNNFITLHTHKLKDFLYKEIGNAEIHNNNDDDNDNDDVIR